MRKEFLLTEKYRPKELEHCILPDHLKKTLGEFIDKGEIPNLLFTGSAGIGKTTVAKLLANKLNCDSILINGSEEGRMIDTLRTKIKDFASAMSLSGGKKVIILDEADYSNATSVQPALRAFIEEFSSNCRFIFTCNYKNRIIPELHSRCSVIDFQLKGKEKGQIATKFFHRLQEILRIEEIKCEDKILQQLILKHFPDFRRILNEIQRYSTSGEIDGSILTEFGEVNLNKLIEYLKKQEFTNMRKWVSNNLDNDFQVVIRKVYDSLYDVMDPKSIPQAILILHKYLYQGAFVIDPEINLVACFTEIMIECDFK